VGCIIIKGDNRQRYIGFLVESKKHKSAIHRSEINKVLRRQCTCLFSKDCKELGILLIRFDGVHGILRCRHRETDHAMRLLTSIHQVGTQPVTIMTVGTAGTIRSLTRKCFSKTK
jgi:RNase P/RNase MRP subunit POP5